MKNRIEDSSRKDIIALFSKYKFKDEHSHDLLNCLDFQHLLDRAFKDESNDPN